MSGLKIMNKLFELNPELDRAALAATFALDTRVQVRDFLTSETAEEIRRILATGTPWGLAMQAEGSEFVGPQQITPQELRAPAGQQRAQAIGQATQEAAARGDYAFRFAQYPFLEAMKQRWEPGGPHELILEHINSNEFLELARDITGEHLVKADGQAHEICHPPATP